MIEVLSQTHNILSISPESVPERLQGRRLICYLPGRDAVIISGWKEDTPMIAELITDYLELTPPQHERVLEAPIHIGLSDKILQIHRTLEAIYQIRNGNKG